VLATRSVSERPRLGIRYLVGPFVDLLGRPSGLLEKFVDCCCFVWTSSNNGWWNEV